MLSTDMLIVAALPISIAPDLPGSLVEKCGQCNDTVRIGLAERSVIPAGAVIGSYVCIPCLAFSGNPAARILYKVLYGPTEDWARPDPMNTAPAPRCAHVRREWMPVMLMQLGPLQLGRSLVPVVFCEACSGGIHYADFADYVAMAFPPGATGRLIWMRAESVSAQLFAKPVATEVIFPPFGRG